MVRTIGINQFANDINLILFTRLYVVRPYACRNLLDSIVGQRLVALRDTINDDFWDAMYTTEFSNDVLEDYFNDNINDFVDWFGKNMDDIVYFDEVKDFAECGLCGTAAVISPVGKIVDHGKEICLPSGMSEMGPVTKKLYDTLTGIQMGRIEAPEGWVVEI